MKYSKTAIITFHSGAQTTQILESDKPLTAAVMVDKLNEIEIYRGRAHTTFLDTPKPVVILPEVAVYVGVKDNHLFMGYSLDGEWSPFWEVPKLFNRKVVIDIMVTARRKGTLGMESSGKPRFTGDIGDLMPIAECDSKGMRFHFEHMTDDMKTGFGFV